MVTPAMIDIERQAHRETVQAMRDEIADRDMELAYARAFLTPVAGPWLPSDGRLRRRDAHGSVVASVVPRLWCGQDYVLWFALPPGQVALGLGDVEECPTEDEARAAADAALRANGWFLREE